MRLRSLLFVPGDRPERFVKAAASGADAIILDLEDSVSLANKENARAAIADYLAMPREVIVVVRVNPLDGALTGADVASLAAVPPDAIMVPKAEGAATVHQIDAMLSEAMPVGTALPLILPIASETASAIFALGSYRETSARLAGLTWGAEDLPACIGASTGRLADGSFTPPLETARSLTLFAAHSAGTAAIETVFPAIKDEAGMAQFAARARRDGFTGMMAIHPAQIAAIHQAFKPSSEELDRARAIVEAFAANPGAGVLQIGGKMIDAPHLKQAHRILSLV